MKFKTVLLDVTHKKEVFDCGNAILNTYLYSYAFQDMKRQLSRIYVLPDHQGQIKGFYTLSASSFRFESIPEALRQRLPRYPLPAILIGRLAVDQKLQAQGLGRHLLMDALSRILRANQSIGIYAAVVDAKDLYAKSFYEKYGFIAFNKEPLKLFLPLATIKQATQQKT